MSQEVKERVIPLNLTYDYARNWKTWEGIREVIQNWHDGILFSIERRHEELYRGVPVGREGKVEYKVGENNENFMKYESHLVKPDPKHPDHGCLYYEKKNRRLILINRNTQLGKKVLLLGYSSKPMSSDVIGQFGEGLKVGALALVREGLTVCLETSREKWDFQIDTYKDIDPNIKGLNVHVTKRIESSFNWCPEDDVKLDESDTCTIVSPLDEDDWEDFRKKFLFLYPPVDSVPTEMGTLLLDDQLAGQLYVRGIWVADFSQDNLSTGVDFNSLAIDRDRNAIPRSSKIDHQVSRMWPRALEKRRADERLVKKCYNILQKNPHARDIKHATKYFNETTANLMAEQFRIDYPNKFPILETTEFQEMEKIQTNLRREVVRCNQTLLNILHLSKKFEPVDQALSSAKKQVPPAIKHVHALSSAERDVLDHAIELTKILDPSFSDAFIDIIEAEMQENVYAVDGNRIIIPRFLFDLDVVHTFARHCPEEASTCMCREVKLCGVFVSARQKHLKLPPRQGGAPAPDPPLVTILGQVAAQTCEETPPFCVDIHKRGHVLNSQETHKDCIAQEKELRDAKHRLGVNLENATKEYQSDVNDLQHECEMLREELMSKEITNNGYGEDLKNLEIKYQEQLNDAKQKYPQALKEREDFKNVSEEKIHDLNTDLHIRDQRIKDLEKEESDIPKRLERKHHDLVDKVNRKGEILKKIYDKIESNKKMNMVEMNEDLLVAASACADVSDWLKEEPYICVVCKCKKRSYLVRPCGHFCLCENCNDDWVKSQKEQCPKCNINIVEIIKVYE